MTAIPATEPQPVLHASGAGRGDAHAATGPRPGAGSDGAERFIPVSRPALRSVLLDMLAADGGSRRQWGRALDCLEAWRHQDYRQRVGAILDSYLLFSPDADTVNLVDLDAAAKEKARRALLADIEALLVQANYIRLGEDDIRRLLAEQSPYGLRLNVDLSDFDEALLYYRGTAVEAREERNPWRLYLTIDRYESPLFERLFLLLKLKPIEARAAEIAAATGMPRDKARKLAQRQRRHVPIGVSSEVIYVKVFKRIPQIDLEMLFPNTRIAFRPFDKLRLLVTAGGGTVAGVMGSATKLLAFTNPFTLAIGLAGLSAVIFRQVSKVFHTRNHYMMVLAQNLYFHTLANNHGALTLIADRAEEEDVKEDMLLYVFLARHPLQYDALSEIKAEIEQFLARRCGVAVHFDAEDALRRLVADGLIRRDAAGHLDAIPPSEARAHLDKLWDRLLDVETLDRSAAPAEA